MSRRRLVLSADLKRLQDEGYDIEVRPSGHLVVSHIPYVTAQGEVAYGMLACPLNMSGDTTATPDSHVVYFAGMTPCDTNGQPLSQVINSEQHQTLAPELDVQLTLSNKPVGANGYPDYYAQITSYITLLSGPAAALQADVTARTFPVIEDDDEGESVFKYYDTASSRAGIAAYAEKLRVDKLAIIGLGGTGAYILDLVAKTPAKSIHLYDGDVFHQHNAFRAPGAPTLEELAKKPMKTDYYASVYGKMRETVVSHPYYVTAENVHELLDSSFVFLAVDDAPAKGAIMDALENAGVAFIDVGMGVWQGESALGGSVRTTTSTPGWRGSRSRISTGQGDEDEYNTNIQIADLNALNATYAVIKYKQLQGFYADLEHQHNSVYEVDGNNLINEDQSS